MGAKKKKGKKKEEVKEQEIIIPNFIPPNLKPLPLSVKIKHLKDIFYIYTDEYKRGIDIKNEFARVINKQPDEIKLYLQNKRVVEDETTNHDQQITNGTVIFASFKIVTEEKTEWENIKDIINFGLEPPAEEKKEGV